MSAVMSDVHRQARSPAARQRLFHLPTPARPALRLIEPKRKIAKKRRSLLSIRSKPMTIDPFLTGKAFDQRAIREMSRAFESVCNGLGIGDDEANRRLVAEKIIELAGHGMHGATLRAATIKEVNAMSDNAQKLAQSLSCSNCGHAVPLPAASTSNDTLVICPACGADLGRWGDVKES
jgi:DNA-directed RNA polymerase subunit RPC12/RpoP